MTKTVKDFVRKKECEEDGMYFVRYMQKAVTGDKFNLAPFHQTIQNALDKTMLPPDHPEHVNRLIINVPPGYGKTLMSSVMYMARGLAINPKARFLHISYSTTLVTDNSSDTKDVVECDEFQALWPMSVRKDKKAKSMWFTEDAGGVNAKSIDGQVTGFRGGKLDKVKFSGAMIIDDPLKVADAYSELVRSNNNRSYNATLSSRLAVQSVPVIVIMQRLHWDDMTGYLLRGGAGCKWHHLSLPVIIDNNKPYPEDYTHGIPIDHDLPDGWLWETKHGDNDEPELRAHRRTFHAQYMQDPIKRDAETALWTEKLITKCRELTTDGHRLIRTIVSIDPAVTNTENSDEHGLIVASQYEGDLYSIDADHSHKGSPLTWAQKAMWAVNEYDADAIIIETNQGGDMCESNLRNAGYQGRVIRVHATKGKTLRAEPVVALYELGKISHDGKLIDLEEEMLDFDPVSQTSNGKSPNRIDAMVHAVTELAGIGGKMGQLLDMALGGMR